MTQLVQAKTPFLSQFQEFYAEIIRLKQLALAGAPPASVTATTAATEADSPESFPATIWNRAFRLLDRQVQETRQATGPIGIELQREGLWVMAALADEIFVHMDWSGKDYWLSHLLETRLFRTQSAGETFFTRLEHLLERTDPAAEETASIYLMALALGFRGKYWGADDAGAIDAYRRKLFAFLVRRNPRLIADTKRLFPDAYRHTIQEGPVRRLPDPRRWLLIVAAVFVLWLVTSQAAWWTLTSDMIQRIEKITLTEKAG